MAPSRQNDAQGSQTLKVGGEGRHADGCRHPGRAASWHRRARGLPAPAPGGRRAGADADGPQRGAGAGGRLRGRRRRLPRQAVRVRGAAGQDQGAAAKGPQRLEHRGAALRRPAHGPLHPRGVARRPLHLAHPPGVRPVVAVPGAPAPGADAVDDPGAGLGLRLRPRLQRAGGLRGLPSPQAGDRGRAPGDPHRPRGRLRAPRGPGRRPMSFRARLTVAYLVLLMLALTAFGFGVYTYVDRRLHDEFAYSVQSQGQALGRLLYSYDFANDIHENGQLGRKTPDQKPGTWMQIAMGEDKDRKRWAIDAKSPNTDENAGVRLPHVAYNRVTRVQADLNDLHIPLAVYSEPFEALQSVPPGEKGRQANLPAPDVQKTPPKKLYGEVTVARSLDSVESSLRLLRSILIGGGLAVLLVAALIGSGLAAALLRPLAGMRPTAQQIGDDRDFTKRLPVEGKPHNRRDELGRLSLTFNQMLNELERSHVDLQTTLDSQRRFVADASHELRTPITAMRRMESLIGDLLALARLEAATRSAPRRIFRLDHLVADIHRDSGRHASDAVEVRLGPLPEAWVLGDRDDLRRAIWNVADNALKYTRTGWVELSMAVHDGRAEVRVADSGIGIEDEHLDRMFDRFWRAPSVRGMAGSGLGLAIVKWVAELHGGGVSVESQPGRGSIVTIDLPATVRQGVARRLQQQVEQIGRLAPVGRS